MKGVPETRQWRVSALNGRSPGHLRYGAPSDDRVRGEPPAACRPRLGGAGFQHGSSRRQKTLAVTIPYRGSNGPLNLLIDSTGIKADGVRRDRRASGTA